MTMQRIWIGWSTLLHGELIRWKASNPLALRSRHLKDRKHGPILQILLTRRWRKRGSRRLGLAVYLNQSTHSIVVLVSSRYLMNVDDRRRLLPVMHQLCGMANPTTAVSQPLQLIPTNSVRHQKHLRLPPLHCILRRRHYHLKPLSPSLSPSRL